MFLAPIKQLVSSILTKENLERTNSCFGLDVCGSSQNEYGRIRMVETFCSSQTYLRRSLEIYIIF